jgi:hypothetical protein
MRAKSSPERAQNRTKLAHAVMNGYVNWREESAAVGVAYRHWQRAGRDHRARAYEAYLAALDREEGAAEAYRSLTELANAA